MASYICSRFTRAGSYRRVNASLSRLTCISSCIPGNSDRAATTLSGQLIQVTPPRLFIIPSTKSVTCDISASTASALTENEINIPAKAKKAMELSLVWFLVTCGLSLLRIFLNYRTCTYYRFNYFQVR